MKILLSLLCLCLLTGCMYDPFRPTELKLADRLERETEMRVIHSEFKGGDWELFIAPAKLDTTTVEGYDEYIEAKEKFNNDELTVEKFMEIEAVFQENVRRVRQERFKNFLDRTWRLAFEHERLWVTPNHWSEEDGQKILD